MQLKIYQVDAFTDAAFGGNPAAIVQLEKWLDDAVMQKIAMENNLSETAFLVQNKDEFDIRWFTPKAEIDLCGHATLASAFVLFEHSGYQKKQIIFNYGGGQLTVNKNEDLLEMNFPANSPVRVAAPAGLSEAFGAKPDKVLKARDYLLVYKNEETIQKLDPDLRALTEFDAAVFIATAPGKNVDFVSRVFAPKLGIDEDPVTGSAHTELIPFWSSETGKTTMNALQLSARGGEIFCELMGDRVKIAGKAKLYMVGEIFI